MRSSGFWAGVFACLQLQHVFGSPMPQAAPATSLVTDFSTVPAPTVPIGGQGSFVSVDPTSKLFNINGKTQYFAGINAYFLALTYNNSDVDKVLGEISKSGLLVARLWGFSNTNDASTAENHFFQELKDGKQSLNTDPNSGIPKLDYVISKAEALNIKLILPLLNGYPDLGGIDTYVTNYGGTPTSFFTDNASQTAYLAYVDFIINRYKDSPAIFSWEICNEPHCPGCDTSIITNWAKSVSAHIKGLDPKHLVSLGDEGWFAPPQPVPAGANNAPYTGAQGVNFTANLALPDIDFGTFHMYPVESDSETQDWGNTYIQEHADVGKMLGKPVIMEEYNTKVSDRAGIVSKWQSTVLNSTLAGDLIWQFNDTLSSEYKPVQDGYGVLYSEVAGSEYDVLVTQHAGAMSAKVVGGS